MVVVVVFVYIFLFVYTAAIQPWDEFNNPDIFFGGKSAVYTVKFKLLPLQGQSKRHIPTGPYLQDVSGGLATRFHSSVAHEPCDRVLNRTLLTQITRESSGTLTKKQIRYVIYI